jgi:response regulator RpfG family c-di-GMP phosphodiesterase
MKDALSNILSLSTDGAAVMASDAPPRELAVEADSGGSLSIRVGLYIALVALSAAACLAFFAPDLSRDGWQGFVTLVAVAIVLERFGIQIYGDTRVSAGAVALIAIGMLYGPSGAAVAAPIVVLAATAFTSSPWYGRVFDTSSFTVANVCTALVFTSFIDVDAGVTGWWVAGGVAATAVNYAINSGLVAGAVALETGEPVFEVWSREHRWLAPYYVVFGLLALALATAYIALQVTGVLAFVAPPVMMRFALHQYVTKTEQTVLELKQKNAELEAANHNIIQMTHQLTETYDGTLEALVLALDARDRETKGHSFRVASYVVAIAREMGVLEGTPALIDMQRGALLHDVGKIGVPDFILHKPGPLTPEEWDDMKRHPHIGFDMLKDIGFLTGAAAIVRTHHERFDGKGYPRGLRGEEIPLGSRIFSIADAFDAMTSDRPYRKALPPEMARAEVLRHSGTQFDPKVVQAFLLVYERLEKEALEERHEEHARAA